ncbi:ribonucleotide reductase A subunit [Elephant endotheliotropic herpesvirus 3A]|uniref:Ribonucleotide reductase A subunit n=1 Tax=Elephant endotheliotropic herpesvirus 3A TaxID=1329409 RepID=A0A866VSP1_9BETA|nr:ribonucleotide reductase A subunit [Elephant endotheliotropic herpesvirus 3A]QOE74433.1 ribonucleotide reductase A subunit [Elephant endotheliotropic herpesvirus 3A]
MALYLQDGNEVLQALKEADDGLYDSIMKLKKENESDLSAPCGGAGACVSPSASSPGTPMVKLFSFLKYMQVAQHNRPDLDGVLGAMCHLANEKKACASVRHYAEHYANVLSTDIRLFLYNMHRQIESRFVRTNTETFLRLEGLGFMSAMKFANIYSRHYDGRVESLTHFYCRLSAFFASCIIRNPAYYNYFRKVDVLSVFGDVFRALTSHTITLCSPVMLNAGVSASNLTSCFIVARDLECNADINEVHQGILRQILDCGGGIGLDCTIFGTGLDLFKYLKLLNATVEFYNESLRRPVGLSVSIEMWHSNVLKLLRMKMPNAAEEESCPSLFNAVMVPDLFFNRYEADPNAKWSLFSGNMAKVLSAAYGKKFESAYLKYEKLGLYDRQLPIKEVLFALINCIASTGTPYVLFKDALNRNYYMDESPTSSAYVVRSSNLCAEIVHHANDLEIGVCNISSVNLLTFVRPYVPVDHQNQNVDVDFVLNDDNTMVFCLRDLREAVSKTVLLVNCAITESSGIPTGARLAANRYRSMGIGTQGLHSAFIEMKLDYTSPTARKLNKQIYENIYYAAVHTSMSLCRNGLEPFYHFHKSKYNRGWLHFDGWRGEVCLTLPEEWWGKLRANICKYGLFNAQFVALMPTSGTSQLSAVSEAFYPNFSNHHAKVTTGVEVLVANKKLQKEFRYHAEYLRNIDWEVTRACRDYFSEADWQRLMLYKNAFEYEQTALIDMCAERAPFVDHSQSMSFFVKESHLTGSKHIYNLLRHAHKRGLKTGMYYLRIQKQARLSDLEKTKRPQRDDGSCAATPDDAETTEPSYPLSAECNGECELTRGGGTTVVDNFTSSDDCLCCT